MRYHILMILIILIYISSMPMPVFSGTDAGDWSGTWGLWTQEQGVNGEWIKIGTISLVETKTYDAVYGSNYIVTGTYEGGRIESHEPTQGTKIFCYWYDASPGSSYWDSFKNVYMANSIPISQGDINLEKKWPEYKELQDKMLLRDDNSIRPYTGADFCSGRIEIFEEEYKDIWGFREQRTEIQTGSVTGAQTGLGTDTQTESGIGTQTESGIGTQTGSGIGTQTGSGIGTQTGSGIGTQTGSGTEANKPEAESLTGVSSESSGKIEIVTSQGTTSLNQGETRRIELTSEQKAEIDLRCDELKYKLMLIYYASDSYSSWDSCSFGIALNLLKIACDSLKSGNPISFQKTAEFADRSSLSDVDNPVQLQIDLEQGSIRPEIVNDLVALIIGTPTATVFSEGINAFGVAYNPTSGKSIISAYQNPIEVKPIDSNLAPFTLENGQRVEIGLDGITPIGDNNEGSSSVSPEGTDIPGTLGGTINTQPSSDPTEASQGGCYQDPLTGEIICVDNWGNPINTESGQDTPQTQQEPSSGGCYQDPFTGEITCVDTSGNPANTESGQGYPQTIQDPSSEGCYQDPFTGEITCVDTSGQPADIFAPEEGCYTDPMTGEVTCIG